MGALVVPNRLRGVEQVGRENLQAAIKRRDCAF